jgi:phosphoenolpyruvate-protein kinase (PTS system EI component)
MAADQKMIPFLVGIGIKTLSIEVRLIPKVHHFVSELVMSEAKEKADALLRLGRISEVAAMLGIK